MGAISIQNRFSPTDEEIENFVESTFGGMIDLEIEIESIERTKSKVKDFVAKYVNQAISYKSTDQHNDEKNH
jgi:hypothetical protein